MMKFNQKNNDNHKHILNKNKKTCHRGTIETLNYLYPNGHRITHQMRWLKISKEKGLKSDDAA